jgi:uncharacterized membrane protein YczE
VVGLVLLGFGLALMVAADLGLAPWEVFHQGISDRTGVPIGTVGIIVGVIVLLAWIPLGERPGIGTVLNVIIIGLVIDATLLWLETPESMALRIAFLAAGIFLWGPGSGLYIGVRLGPGPRDGLMTSLAHRYGRVGTIRFGIEAVVLVAGVLLGGTAGAGTVIFVLAIGPLMSIFLPRYDLGPMRDPGDQSSAVPSSEP